MTEEIQTQDSSLDIVCGKGTVMDVMREMHRRGYTGLGFGRSQFYKWKDKGSLKPNVHGQYTERSIRNLINAEGLSKPNEERDPGIELKRKKMSAEQGIREAELYLKQAEVEKVKGSLVPKDEAEARGIDLVEVLKISLQQECDRKNRDWFEIGRDAGPDAMGMAIWEDLSQVLNMLAGVNEIIVEEPADTATVS